MTAVILGTGYMLTVATTTAFVARDTVPPRWDAAGHLLRCLQYADLLASSTSQFLWGHYAYYPPLVYQVTGALHAVLGSSRWVPLAVIQCFVLILLVATYVLGRAVSGVNAGRLAAVSVLLLPIVTVFTREFALDVPLLAISMGFLALAFDAPLGSGARASAVGVAMGLGLLTKWTFAILAIGPLAYLGWTAFSARAARRQAASRLALALSIAAALAAPWYVSHWDRLWADTRLNAVAVAAREGDPAVGSAAAFLYYVRIAVNEWLYVPLALAAAWGLAVSARRNGRVRTLLAITAVPAYIVFSLIPNKDPRYALPIVPCVLIALADAVANTTSGFARRALTTVLAVLLVSQHLGGVLYLGPLSRRVNGCLPGLAARIYEPADPPVYFRLAAQSGGHCASEWTVFNPYSYFGRPPRREDWRIDDILSAIPDGAAIDPPPADDVHLNPVLLEYTAKRMGRNLTWAQRAPILIFRRTPGSEPPAAWHCRSFDQPDKSVVSVCRVHSNQIRIES